MKFRTSRRFRSTTAGLLATLSPALRLAAPVPNTPVPEEFLHLRQIRECPRAHLHNLASRNMCALDSPQPQSHHPCDTGGIPEEQGTSRLRARHPACTKWLQGGLHLSLESMRSPSELRISAVRAARQQRWKQGRGGSNREPRSPWTISLRALTR